MADFKNLMKLSRLFLFVMVLVLLPWYVSCALLPAHQSPGVTVTAPLPASTVAATGQTPQRTQSAMPEEPVTLIRLSGPVADASAEISGLAWYSDTLILLPQYPDRFDSNGDGFLYSLPKADILAYLDGRASGPLQPRAIQLTAPGLRKKVPHYQGFESIGFYGDRFFLTIEAGKGTNMMGYLISGMIQPDLSALTLDTTRLTEIPPQAVSENHSDEAILLRDNKIITFYEINGQAINPHPVAHVFNFDLQPQGTLSMPNIEYRITDTAWTTDDQFWAINYFFPGDVDLWPRNDPIIDTFGEGPTQSQNLQVERLVKFQYSDSGITLMNIPPVQLVLSHDVRDWEGLVLLDDRGFLMATDTHPTTLLAFVPLPK